MVRTHDVSFEECPGHWRFCEGHRRDRGSLGCPTRGYLERDELL